MKPDFQTSWKSPSNIALIKYWGKHGIQLPNNPSLSMTLNKANTFTRIKAYRLDSGIQVKYYFEKKQRVDFEKKILKYLQKLIDDMPFINEYAFEINSSNSFPHSTGIASSASSMSALALCLVSLENYVLKKDYSDEAFYNRASYIARLGSGSASRSVYGGWCTWGKIEGVPDSSNLYASPLNSPVDSLFDNMGDAVLVVSSSPKSVSSSMGHSLMNVHPFAKSRYLQAEENLQALMVAMQVGDFDSFSSIVENEALTLHSLLMTSSPDGLLLKPGTIQIIEAVRKYRAQTGVKICFTIDAGPNVHILYAKNEEQKVYQFINSDLLAFCEKSYWIDDKAGSGPEQME